MPSQQVLQGPRRASTAWGGGYPYKNGHAPKWGPLLDQDSVLVDEEGNPGLLDTETADALLAGFEQTTPQGQLGLLQAILTETFEVASMDDLGDARLEELLEGIFD